MPYHAIPSDLQIHHIINIHNYYASTHTGIEAYNYSESSRCLGLPLSSVWYITANVTTLSFIIYGMPVFNPSTANYSPFDLLIEIDIKHECIAYRHDAV